MPEWIDLKRKIEERKKAEPKASAAAAAGPESGNTLGADAMVARLRKQYAAQGIPTEGSSTDVLGSLRENVAGQAHVRLESLDWLLESKSFGLSQVLARVYLLFKPLTHAIQVVLGAFPAAQELTYYLYSASLPFTANQFLSLAAAGCFLLTSVALVVSAFFATSWPVEFPVKAAAVVLTSLVVFLLSAFTFLSYPRLLAVQRGEQASAELPFALRQMATQLRTGGGLYKSFQDLASADYGILSEEFSRTVNEIEEGTETKDAIEKFARRTQSSALRRALLHINRAMRTGGNLSDAMSQIAEDVSFELRMRTRDFAEKMNFFGVLFIVSAIVLPVFLAIVAGITNAPIGIESAAISPEFVALTYLVGLPLLLVYLIAYLVFSQPRV